MASPVGSGRELPLIRAQKGRGSNSHESKGSEGRRAALAFLTATIFASVAHASNSSSNAGIIEEYLEKSKANKELDDYKKVGNKWCKLCKNHFLAQNGGREFQQN